MTIKPRKYDALEWWERRDLRNEYANEQDGLCAHCGELLDGDPSKLVMDAKINWKLFPANFMKYPVHLHHDHTTGMTIGAVHNRCNAFLWQYLGE